MNTQVSLEPFDTTPSPWVPLITFSTTVYLHSKKSPAACCLWPVKVHPSAPLWVKDVRYTIVHDFLTCTVMCRHKSAPQLQEQDFNSRTQHCFMWCNAEFFRELWDTQNPGGCSQRQFVNTTVLENSIFIHTAWERNLYNSIIFRTILIIFYLGCTTYSTSLVLEFSMVRRSIILRSGVC